MNDRDRFGRNREQGGFGQQQRRPWDRQRYQSESGGYPDEDRDRGYSRLGGAGEEDFERYYQGSYQGTRDYDRDYSGREQSGRDYSDERGYYGPERSYGQERYGQERYGQERGYGQERNYGQERYGQERMSQRDWGRQRGSSGSGSQLDFGMREFGDRTGYSYSGPRDSGGYEYGQGGSYGQGSSGQGGFGSQRNQFPYSGNAYGSQRSFDAGRYGQQQPVQYGYGQSSERDRERERGRFAGHGPKGYKRSDERIREDLCDALMMHPEIDASDIEIKVSDGEVTLTGTVRERDDKYLAEQVSDAIPGVREVTNNIRTKRAGNEQSSSNDPSRNARGTASGTSNATQSGPNNSRA